jgi:hypothetical protein
MGRLPIISGVIGIFALSATAIVAVPAVAADDKKSSSFFSFLSSDEKADATPLPAGGKIFKGFAVPDESSKRACGFDRKPFEMRFADGHFVARGVDLRKTARTFEGDVASGGRIEAWSSWVILGGGSRDAQMEKA